MPDIMDERRKEKRRDEIHETVISVLSAEDNHPEEKNFYDYCEDISASGARIHANSLLPVDTLLQMDIKLENMQQLMTTEAKVKWAKVIVSDGSCEAGVEFCPPRQIISMHTMPLLYLYSEEMKNIFM